MSAGRSARSASMTRRATRSTTSNVSHPDGNEHWMGVGLKPDLPDGTYTGTYRVISADTHIVYGGLVFNIGHAGAAPKFTVAGLIGKNKSGKVTEVAFGVVRGLELPDARADGRRPRLPVRRLAARA